MMTTARRASSFLANKGLFPEHTYQAFGRWDLSLPLKENVRRVREDNTVGGPSLGWLNDFGKVLLRRFGPAGPDVSLVELAQRGCPLSTWKPLLLWHGAATDSLLTSFLSDWLLKEKERGVVRITGAAAEGFLRQFLARLPGTSWSDANITAAAGGLLRTASSFGLLTSGRVRGFAPFQLPQDSFLYCAHHLTQKHQSTSRVVSDPAWRLFLMTPDIVETELFRLHQLGRLQFDRAGSLVDLRLPFKSAAEFARRMIA